MAKGNGAAKTHGRLGLYRSYNFVEKDPVIDRLRTLMQKEHVDNKDVAKLSGVSQSTLFNWFDGKTRRPTYACVAAVSSSLGYSPKFVKTKRVDLAKALAKAEEEIAAAKEKLDKEKGK